MFYASLIGALLSLGIGAWYFLQSPADSSLFRRFLTSAYAPSTAVMYVVAFVVPREEWIGLGNAALLVIQVVPAVLLIISLFGYPGNKRLHILLVPFALVFWACQFLIAQIGVYGM